MSAYNLTIRKKPLMPVRRFGTMAADDVPDFRMLAHVRRSAIMASLGRRRALDSAEHQLLLMFYV